MVWIKICANTTLEDTQQAVDLGADAVGFVFAPSARRVTPEQAGRITAGLRGAVERIGVFQTGDYAGIRDAVRVAGLSGVQMHGEFAPGLTGELRAEFGDGFRIAQTLHWVVDASVSHAAELGARVAELQAEGLVDRILVDSKVGTALGGTGRRFNWEQGKVLFREGGGMRMIVAGGLDPENVGEAIARLKPWGVDVASGVERVPGEKDPERLGKFIERARAAAKGSF